MAHLSVVIPVYKAEGCLNVLYQRLKHSLEQITQDFEIILVEDCGGDRSNESLCCSSRGKVWATSLSSGRQYSSTGADGDNLQPL